MAVAFKALLQGRTFKRLVLDVYPKDASSSMDENSSPRDSKLKSLVDYLKLYPQKMHLTCAFLEQKVLKDLNLRCTGLSQSKVYAL